MAQEVSAQYSCSKVADAGSSILVLMLDKHLGDFVNALSTLEDIQAQRSSVTVVVDDGLKDLVRSSKLGSVLYYPRSELKRGSLLARMRAYLGFVRALRKLRAEKVVDIGGSVASAHLARLCGASLRYGPASANKSHLYNRPVAQNMGQLRAYHYSDIAAAIGVITRPRVGNLQVGVPDQGRARQLLQAEGLSADQPLACIHAGAGKEYKQWAPERFAKVGAGLLARGYQLAIIGTPNEVLIAEQIKAAMPDDCRARVVDLSGQTSFSELMAVLEIGDLLVGNDSGPMHLACAFSIQVVAIFGPTYDQVWGPLCADATVIKSGSGCGDCPRKAKCTKQYRCLEDITPCQVLREIDRVTTRLVS